SSKCVLPVPTGPNSTSGLAASPGASTTLEAEACATRLHGPTTNSLRRCQRRVRRFAGVGATGASGSFAGGGGAGAALAGRGAGEGLLQPFLEMAVGHADDQLIVGPAEPRVPLEPELVARLADPLADRLRQGQFDVALECDHGAPSGARSLHLG